MFTRLALTSTVLLGLSAPAQAAFVLIEDFEGGTVDNKLDTGSWDQNGDEKAFFASDPAGGVNQVGSFEGVAGGGSFADLPLGSEAIADNTTGTLFFRARAAVGQSNHIFGLADVNPTTDFNAFEAMVIFSDTEPDVRVRDGGNTDDTGEDLGTEVWTNFWVVVNNTDDTYEVYMNTGVAAATAADLITDHDADDVDFRNGTSSALTHFFSGTGANNITDELPLYLDDIYVDNGGANLTNPIPEPASLALVGIGSLLVLGGRRRRAA